MNKKITIIITTGMVILSVIVIGALFLRNNRNKAQNISKSINTSTRNEKDIRSLVIEEGKQSPKIEGEKQISNSNSSNTITNNGVKVEIVRGKKYCSYEQYPNMGFQQSIKVSYADNNKKEKIIYTTSNKINGREVTTYTENDCLFLESIGSLILSPDGKYLIFHKSGWESSKPYMINIDTEKYVFGDKDNIFIIRDILWSPNNKNFVVTTDVNEMGGVGELGIYASEYNNPDKIKEVWIAKNYLLADIKEINFIGNEIIDFNIEQKECYDTAKLCPDGTRVVRIGPSCEFEDCAIKNKTKDIAKKTIKYEYNFRENRLVQID